MSSTRRQNPDAKEFRPDAFASSSEYSRGVLGNLVAARCERISDREAVSILWWLQQLSWRDGGLERFATDFLAANPHLLGTPSMHAFGQKPGQVYHADQVRQVRGEIRRAKRFFAREFPLKGEQTVAETVTDLDGTRTRNHPESYPVTEFQKACQIEADELAKELKRFLVDPATDPVKGLWNMPGLWSALANARDHEAGQASKRFIETEVTRKVFEELDFVLESGAFVLIEGREGIGKTHAARNWCERHPGRAVYVRLESGIDDTTLFRSIARVIGTACAYARKTTDMRARIQDTLQTGQLMLVLDEAHTLWPHSGRPERAAPKRIEWLRTAIVDFGVPVALISTPQHFAQQCLRYQKAGWNSLQIQRRLARTARLPEPDQIPVSDVERVVSHYFPSVSRQNRLRITGLSIGTVGFITTIVHLRKRVDFLAQRRPGKCEADVLIEAMAEMGLAKEALEPAQDPVEAGLSRSQEPLLPPPLAARSRPAKVVSTEPVCSA